MTESRGSQGWDDVHALAGAYAVNALDPDERARFEAHLQQCGECRDEVESFRETAAALGAGDAVAPPLSVREAVLSGIGSIRPLPPLPPQEYDGPVDPLPPAATTAPDDLAARRRRRLDARRIPLLVAAAAVLIAAVGGSFWLRTGDEPAPQITVAEKVLAAEDAERFEKRFPEGATAQIVISRSEGRAVIVTEDMKPPPDGKDYQLWLQTPAGVLQSAGVMPGTRDTTKVLEGDASRATGVGITVEPDGGSEQPTSDPIVFFPLKA